MPKNYNFVALTIALLFVSFGITYSPSAEAAKSTTWTSSNISSLSSYALGVYCYDRCNDLDYAKLVGTFIHSGSIYGIVANITYSADAKRNDTDEVLNITDANIPTVPANTAITFQPKALENTDISWNNTGFSADTPYGTWSSGSGVQCNANTFVGDRYYHSAYIAGYTSLNIAPPTPTIDTTGSTASVNCAGLVCTPTSAGRVRATITWPATTGKFYYKYTKTGPSGISQHPQGYYLEAGSCLGSSPMQISDPTTCNYWSTPSTHVNLLLNEIFSSAEQDACMATLNPYVLNVPAKTVVLEVDVVALNSAPNQPTISNVASCTTGSPVSVTVSGTDPDGDDVRYQFDWNKDGLVDQTMPNFGYVNSGTEQTTSRAWASNGSYSFQVRTQDVNSSVSSWRSSNTFTCAPLPSVQLNFQ